MVRDSTEETRRTRPKRGTAAVEQVSNDCEKEVTAANTTMSRKLKKMLNESKEQLQSNENVKRRKRNCRTPDDGIKSKTDLSLDCNRNNVNFTKHGVQSSVSEADSKTEILCEESHNVTKTKIDEKELKNLDPFQRELIVKGLGKRDTVPEIKGSRGHWEKSQSMMHYFQQFAYGSRCRLELRKSVSRPLVDLISNLSLHRVGSPFDRRVTALEWHPTKPNILGVGSKGGDIILWDTEQVNQDDRFVTGDGAGGSCQAMKFWPWDLDRVVSASINGTVTLHDFEGRQKQILADTMDPYDHWFCSVDVCKSRYLVAAGRNHGILRLMSTEGRQVFEFRLHKDKVTHVEFSPSEDWLLCTASTDKTVQLWDLRMMKDRTSSLATLKHERPINSAYFSCTDGCRLLTTDQNNEIRVYRSPSWHLERTILHPHRFFQHISPYKATWHPLQDLIVVGRYPDKNFPGYQDNELRTIDIIDADSGETVYQLHDPGADGLTPLNKFNRQGDTLASGMGFHILLWNRKELIEAKQTALKKGLTDIMLGSLPRSGSRSGQRSRPRNQGKEKKTKDTKTKDSKTKSVAETKMTKVKLKTKTTKK